MAADHEVTESTSVSVGRDVAGEPGQHAGKDRSRLWLVASIVVGVALVSWFFFAWLVLQRHMVDAAGESVGSAFAILVVVSVIGAIRRHRA